MIEASVVLLNRGIADEAAIIPTLVLAKGAGGSSGYAALAEEGSSTVDIPRLMCEANGRPVDSAKDEYAGWEFVKILDGVPLARVHPIAAKCKTYPGTRVLEHVEVQAISRRVESKAVRELYEHALSKYGARWSENNHGNISYHFDRGYLSVQVSTGDDLDPQTVRSLEEGFFRHPAFHFPPPTLVEGFCSSLLGSVDSRNRKGFAYALDIYGKPQDKNPLRLILAFVAWHVGEGFDSTRPRTQIPDKKRVAQLLNRQVLRELDDPPKDPWGSSNRASADAEKLGVDRFVRLYAMGPASFLTGR